MTKKNDEIPEHTWLIVEAIANMQTRIKRAEHLLGKIPAGLRTESAYFDLVMGDRESFAAAIERRAQRQDDEWVTASEAAERLNLSRQTIRNYVRNGAVEGRPGIRQAHGGTPPTMVRWAQVSTYAKRNNVG